MDTCERHPGRQATYYCQKHGKGMCDECAHCGDPKLYCKFRESCLINFLEKTGELEDIREAAREAASEG